MKESPVKIYRTLNSAQQKRIDEDHRASVAVAEDGSLDYLIETIITPKGLSKENKRIWVVPSKEEKVVSIKEAPYLFQELGHMNVILTNACNLSCSYCYEQHKKDFGRFTEESLLSAYNFLINSSKKEFKIFQFFGGEPLIHKDLILNFVENHKDYLLANYRDDNKTIVSMITNGVLLSPDFITKYFSYEFTNIMVSLDTLDSEVDHRELSQSQIDKIIESVAAIPEHAKDRLWMRCTVSRETTPGLEGYIKKVHDIGVKSIIIHPLVLDSTHGFIRWTEQEWNNLRTTIITAIEQYPDLTISFSEGVGKKGDNNCMIGSDMIAIDGSGDFSGCYFFTNQKAGPTNKMILGNIFNETIYIDRYTEFQREFMKMFEVEEQCRSCNYKDHCYQCPAGNMDTGSRMFRPDDMCQKIVKLYLDLQNDVVKKQFAVGFQRMMDIVNEKGEDEAFRSCGFYSMYTMMSGKHLTADEEKIVPGVPATEMFAMWRNLVQSKYKPDYSSFYAFTQSLPINCSENLSVKELYEFLLDHLHLPKTKSAQLKELNLEARVGYMVLLQVLAINYKNGNLQGVLSSKILENAI
jgi:radical SAM protein with 4Fe4S-binding SPASM domain